MSQNAPKPQKPNFTMMLMMFAVVFLGMQLLFKPNSQDKRTPEQIRTSFVALEKKSPDNTDEMQSLVHELHGLKPDEADPKYAAWKTAYLASWKSYTDALEKKGYSGPPDERNPKLEVVDQEYTNLRDAYPEDFQNMGGAATLARIHKDLDDRYAIEHRYYLGAGYQVIHWLVNLTGANPWYSYALAIMLFAVGVRILLFPIQMSQFRWMRQMKAVAPVVDKLKEHYSGPELYAKQQELFKKYGINQLAGCLGMAIPIPFFIWLYSIVRLYRFQFEKGYFLWINPSTAESVNNWFSSTFHIPKSFQLIGPNLGSHDTILVALYAISMYVQQRMMVTDPAQEKQQKMMALFMSVGFAALMFFSKWASAFLLYWLSFNVLYTLQQVWANRQPAPVFEFELPQVATATNGKGKGTPKAQKPMAKKRRR